MANLWTTPWNFTTADQAATAAITSITRNGFRSATIVTAANTFTLNQFISVQGQTGALFPWNGVYRIETVVSTTQFIVSIRDWQSTLGNVGAVGNVFSVAYVGDIFVQQMLWDNPTATNTINLTDVTGDTVWNANAPTSGGTLTYMKAEPVNGLVINALPSGTLQVSIH